LNGARIADAADMRGTFRVFEMDVTKRVVADRPNALAVEVAAPTEKDLAIGFVDWNPSPPDKSMGLWKEVWLVPSGPVALRHPFVSPKLDPERKAAALTVSADLVSVAAKPVEGTLRVTIDGKTAAQPVSLGAGETKTVTLLPESFPALRLASPRLWWPHDMGTPELYDASVSFETGGRVSDAAAVRFGVREVTTETNEIGAKLFRVNGRKVLVRGA